ncbi:hypothetical protein, conserved [Eimeria acervulina]|uniref:Uncharacterized protein n=1 Tax=Eimeria acervulina TaxID=5801 RepID=U6GTQ0_EIMAC|nr:hypothetical protein, conserved [Eimeria acervulina]CDI83621.1 hypothetical protein, conserved [Eimeria acervulina]
MNEKDTESNWTTVVRRGKAQAKATEKASARSKISTAAGKRRAPLPANCAVTPKPKNTQQPKQQTKQQLKQQPKQQSKQQPKQQSKQQPKQQKQQPKPPPTVPANAPSSEQWDSLWPSLSAVPQEPLRRTGAIETAAYSFTEGKQDISDPERGVSDTTDAADTLPTEASDGEHATPKQHKAKAKTCTFKWGMKQEPEALHREPPAATEDGPEKPQLQQQLQAKQQQLQQTQALQQLLRLPLLAPLEEDSMNLLSTSITPSSSCAQCVDDANLLANFRYPSEGTNLSELLYGIYFVLEVLEERRCREDFMESTQIPGLPDPYITTNVECDGVYTRLRAQEEAAAFLADTATYNRKRSYPGEPIEEDIQDENTRDKSACKEEAPFSLPESDEYAADLPKLLHAFRCATKRAGMFTHGQVYHLTKVVEFLLVAAVAETSDEKHSLPASLDEWPPQQLLQLRWLLEMQELPVKYYLRKAATFCKGIAAFLEKPREAYTQEASGVAKPPFEKEVQSSQLLHVMPLPAPEAHHPQTRLREILLHRTFSLVHGDEAIEEQQREQHLPDAGVENKEQSRKRLCQQQLKALHVEYGMLYQWADEGRPASSTFDSLQRPIGNRNEPACTHGTGFPPPPPRDSNARCSQPFWPHQPFPLPPMSLLSTLQPSAHPLKQSSNSECDWPVDPFSVTQCGLQEKECHAGFPLNLHIKQGAELLPTQVWPSAGLIEKPEALLWNTRTGVPVPKEVDWFFDAEVTRESLDNMAGLQPHCQQQQLPNAHSPSISLAPVTPRQTLQVERRQTLSWLLPLAESSLNRSVEAPVEPAANELLQQQHQQLTCSLSADANRDWIACKHFFSASTPSSDTQSCDSCELQEIDNAQLGREKKVSFPQIPQYTAYMGLPKDSPQSRALLAKRRRGKNQQPQQRQQQQNHQHQQPLLQQRQQQRPQQRPQQQQQQQHRKQQVYLKDTQVARILQDQNLPHLLSSSFRKDLRDREITAEEDTITPTDPAAGGCQMQPTTPKQE